MWKLTITGRPNLSLENVRRMNKTTQARQDEFSRLRDLCNTKKDVKMSIITPRYKVDLFGLLRPIVDEAWKRDGGEPLQPFLEKSKYKHVINLGTIAPPEQAPYQKPVPAVVTFTDPKQYAVTMAYGNQSEYYCQHDQARDLVQATGMTAVFLADPGYVVKECGTPRVFIFWLRVPQSQISIEPKAGQSGYLILPRVKKLKYDLSDEELAVSRFSDTELVANGILDALSQAANLNYTGPRLNSFLKDKLKAMLSDDEGSTDVDELLAAVVKINDDEDNDDDITMSQLKQLVAKTKSLKPPTTPQDPLLDESEPVRLSWRRIEGVGSLMPSDMACYRAQVPVDKATGAKRWPVKLDLPDLFRDANGNQIRQHTFVEKCRGHRGTPVQIFIEDSDKTYKTEMNAISKLVHPLTFNEHDRPSEAMHNLTSQIILNDIKDKLPTEHYVPIWCDLYNLANTLNPRLLEKYKRYMELPVWDEETGEPVIDSTTKEPKMKPVIVQPNFKGNSIIIDMSSKESQRGNSYRNDANLAYARQKMVDCLAAQPILDKNDNITWHKLQGIILYVCPYAAQLEAMKRGMRDLGKWAYTSSGQLVEIDSARFSFRTHMSVQGFQASMVIVDYVRSKAPGHSGDPQINNVMLSRACYGQILLLNNSVLKRVNQHAPASVTIKNVFSYHRANSAVVDNVNHKD